MLAIVKATYTKNMIAFSVTATRTSGTTRRKSVAWPTSPSPPDALPWLIEGSTVEAFEAYNAPSERAKLHSRYEVAVEQYVTTINIEAETAASIAARCCSPPRSAG